MKIIQTLGMLVLMLALVSFVACTQESETQAEMDHDGQAKMETQDEVETVAWNKVCPIQGGDVDPEVETVSYDGKEYGFCCPGCDEKFNEDPAKYSAKLNEDGTELLEM